MQTQTVQSKYTRVKIFSATKATDRDALGDKISSWINSNPKIDILDTVVTQSSDSEFHCLAITIFYVLN